MTFNIIRAISIIAVIGTLISLVATYNVTKDLTYKSPLSNCSEGFCDMTQTSIDENGYFIQTTAKVWVGDKVTERNAKQTLGF
jgi:hypothetical protein